MLIYPLQLTLNQFIETDPEPQDLNFYEQKSAEIIRDLFRAAQEIRHKHQLKKMLCVELKNTVTLYSQL